MSKEIRYTRKLGLALARRARISSQTNRYHVVSSFNKPGWSIVREGSVRATKAFDTKQAAISYVRKSFSNLISEIVVHRKDGMVENIIALK